LLDVLAWGEGAAAAEDNLRARIEAQPGGNLVAIDTSTRNIVGSIWTVVCGAQPIANWWTASGRARYSGVCDEAGATVFGVSIAVHPDHHGRGIQAALIQRIVDAAWRAGKREISFGVPMCDFHLWKNTFSSEDYALLQRAGEQVYFRDTLSGRLHCQSNAELLAARSAQRRIDPRAWPTSEAALEPLASYDSSLASFTSVSVDGRVPLVQRVLPGYFPNAGSCDFGVLVTWIDPL
jgi:GNAT superfamily N-acetyltransferase